MAESFKGVSDANLKASYNMLCSDLKYLEQKRCFVKAECEAAFREIVAREEADRRRRESDPVWLLYENMTCTELGQVLLTFEAGLYRLRMTYGPVLDMAVEKLADRLSDLRHLLAKKRTE